MGANLLNVTCNGPWALVFQLGLVSELHVCYHGNTFTAEIFQSSLLGTGCWRGLLRLGSESTTPQLAEDQWSVNGRGSSGRGWGEWGRCDVALLSHVCLCRAWRSSTAGALLGSCLWKTFITTLFSAAHVLIVYSINWCTYVQYIYMHRSLINYCIHWNVFLSMHAWCNSSASKV